MLRDILLLAGAVHLTWPMRMKIAIGAANGMSFCMRKLQDHYYFEILRHLVSYWIR